VLASIDAPDAKLRAELARKAFAHTAAYDKAITEYLNKAQG
jgi:AICAR transformylase/IMP cyclohydrolase PurH